MNSSDQPPATRKMEEDDHASHKNFASRYLFHQNPALSVLSWVTATILILALLFALLLLITYIVFHPKSPKFNIRDVAVRRLGAVVSSPTTFFSTGLLNADIGFLLDVENPNTRLKVLFDDIDFDVFFDDIKVGQAVIAGFTQAKHSGTATLEKDVSSDSVVLPRAVVSSLLRALAQQRISFRLVLRVAIRFQVGALKTPRLRFVEKCRIDVRPFAAFSRGENVIRKNCDSDVKL